VAVRKRPDIDDHPPPRQKMRKPPGIDIMHELLLWLELRTPCPYCGSKSGEPCHSFITGTSKVGTLPYPGIHKARSRRAHAMWRKFVDTVHLQKCEVCSGEIGDGFGNRWRMGERHICGEKRDEVSTALRRGLREESKDVLPPNLAAAVYTIGVLRGVVGPRSQAADLVEQLIGLLEIEDLPEDA
jgi:hypothetical protein